MKKAAKIMSSDKKRCTTYNQEENNMEVIRRGPWTLEEDTLLIHYIACHGEGRWNLLARCSGLKRSGKSCRLRWLNYLKPDVKRGNLTPEEQILILELHSKWGNRWSRIAQYLPGRTDNEIKNYWRTRVQKQARQLKIDANSALFHDAVRCFWMPRLLEKMASSQQVLLHSTTTQNNIDAQPAIIISSSSKQPLQPEMRCGREEFGLYDQMMYDNHTPMMDSQWEETSQFTSVPYYDQHAMTNNDGHINSQLVNGELGGHIDHNLGFPPAALATQGFNGTSFTSEFSMMDNNSIDANMEEDFWNNMDESWQATKLLEWGI